MMAKNILVSALVLGCLVLSSDSARADIDAATLATLKSRFAAADKNGDGKLTREECEAGMPRIYKAFDRIDTDNKGTITLDQIVSFVASR